MRKLILSIMIVLVPFNSIFAQAKMEVSEGSRDNQPTYNETLLMNNGSTFFLCYSDKNGMTVNVYDNSRKLISSKPVKEGIWEPDRTRYEWLYEINGKPTLFTEGSIDKKPTLLRVIFDERTGEVISEDKIAELPKHKIRIGKVIRPHGFKLSKDPYSDCYAVAILNDQSENREKEYMEVIHYNGEHKELARGFFNVAEELGPYQEYMFMNVDGDRQVFLGAQVFDFSIRGSHPHHMAIARLAKGNHVFETKILNTVNMDLNTTAYCSVNPESGKTAVLFDIRSSKTDPNFGKVTTTDITSLMEYTMGTFDLSPIATVSSQMVTELSEKTASKSFATIPKGIIYGPDTTLHIVYEEEREIVGPAVAASSRLQSSSISIELKDIGILDIDPQGKAVSASVITRAQDVEPILPIRSFIVATTGHGIYCLLNKNPEDNVVNGKLRTTKKDERTSLVCYQEINGKMQQVSLNGPADNLPFLDIRSVSYNRSLKTCSAIVFTDVNGEKQFKTAWIKFE